MKIEGMQTDEELQVSEESEVSEKSQLTEKQVNEERRGKKRTRVKKEPASVIAEDPTTSLAQAYVYTSRRSSRRRGAPKAWNKSDEMTDADFERFLTAFEAEAENVAPASQSEEQQIQPEETTSSNATPPKKARRKSNPKQKTNVESTEVEVYDDEHNFGREKFKISKGRAAVPKKRVNRKSPGKKTEAQVENDTEAPEMVPEPGLSDDEGETINLEDVQKYIKHIRTPRSTYNDKYKKVYETIPKLRNASPPRFTTKGVPKKRLMPEELGVRVVGKTVGNPFSSYGKKRNGVIYGNQPLKTIEEMEKYAGAAINVKKVLRKQAERLRLSSYVKPKVLEEVRKEFVDRKINQVKTKEEDVDIDIETVDDSEVNLKSSGARKRTSHRNKGRKPGRTILECQDCGYKTTHSGHMKIHIVCVHKDLKTLQCQYEGCGYKCARKGSMTRHEKCVHRKDEVFTCELCDFVSAWSISLERHIVTKHEKLKPWTCQVCKRSFGQQFTLTTHMNTVHKKVKRIRCAFCNFRSATKVSVRSHILRMHKEEIERAMDDAEQNEGEASEEETATTADDTEMQNENGTNEDAAEQTGAAV